MTDSDAYGDGPTIAEGCNCRHLPPEATCWRCRVDAASIPVADGGIVYDRVCPVCSATTYAYERCHVCGDVPWKNGEQA